MLRRLLPLLGTVLLLAACGGSGGRESAPTTTTTAAAPASGCTRVSPPPTKTRAEPRPTKRLDPSKTYRVAFQTNCGDFTVRLAVQESPATTASFVSLVRKGYFDRTVFHRIVPGFVIQGGDPTASGLGGPGYTTVDRPPSSTRYTLGLVAMAKSESAPPGAAGSQFFVVTARDAQLQPVYAVLGTVTKGLRVVERIGRLGDRATEQPTETVEIESATVVSD
ncbi:MAG: peptidylprolyl isomerase [Gaiellaceae bacterium]